MYGGRNTELNLAPTLREKKLRVYPNKAPLFVSLGGILNELSGRNRNVRTKQTNKVYQECTNSGILHYTYILNKLLISQAILRRTRTRAYGNACNSLYRARNALTL